MIVVKPSTTSDKVTLLLFFLAISSIRLQAYPVDSDGFSALYFQSSNVSQAQNLQGAPVSQIVSMVNFSPSNLWPSIVSNPNLFGARFTGKIQTQQAGNYVFTVAADQGIRLWVDGQIIIDRWQNQAVNQYSGTISLPTAGTFYSVRLEYYHSHSSTNGTLQLSWTPPGSAAQILSTPHVFSGERLYPQAVFSSQIPTDYIHHPAVINIKALYGAKGDGISDDTQAILQAIQDYSNHSPNGSMRILYFPNGTYIVNQRLLFNSDGLGFYGESEGNAIMRLAPGSPQFQDPTNPTDFIKTGNPARDQNNQPIYDSHGQTNVGGDNNAFFNYFHDLTIEIGSNNPGARALYFHGTNNSEIRRLTLRDLGDSTTTGAFVGLYAEFVAGVVENLTVEGFQRGVDTGRLWGGEANFFEHLTLRNQREVGFTVTDNDRVTIRDLRSFNAIQTIGQKLGIGSGLDSGSYTDYNDVTRYSPKRNRGGIAILLDSFLSGGHPSKAAILVEDVTLYLRNVQASGYGWLLVEDGVKVPAGSVTELTTYAPTGPAGQNGHSLNLPIREAPDFHDNNLANWVNVVDFGADPTGQQDSSAAIQAAIDYAAANGKTTVYFPPYQPPNYYYATAHTVTVHGNIQGIIGFLAFLTRSVAEILIN